MWKLQTIGHVHGDIWLKGLGLFLVFGDEKDTQETEGTSVKSTKSAVLNSENSSAVCTGTFFPDR